MVKSAKHDGTFDPSDSTITRWAAHQRSVLLSGLFFGLAAVCTLLTSRGSETLIVLAVGVGLPIAGVAAYTAYRSSARHFPQGALWAGMGTLNASEIKRAALTSHLTFGSALRLNLWTQWRGTVGGRMEVLPEGLRWDMRITAWLAGVTGFVVIPWEQVTDVRVGHIPGTVNRRTGGGYTVTLTSGVRLEGQFLGNRDLLVTALKTSRLR